MPAFLEHARAVDPAKPTYFWTGPAPASRLLAWCATEVAVHLEDVAHAAGDTDGLMSPRRALDGLETTTEFFVDLWPHLHPDAPMPAVVRFVAADLAREVVAGSSAPPVATATAPARTLLLALFGRTVEVEVSGDLRAVDRWRFRPRSPIE